MTQSVIALLANTATAPTQSYVTFNGRRPPGISFPTGAGSPRKWDKQGGYGYSGATLIYMGNDLSEFDVVVQLGYLEDGPTSPHWEQWKSFVSVLAKTPSGPQAKKPELISIGHPLLNQQPWSITQVVILDVTQFEQVSAGLWECRIKCMDARVAQPALGSPSGIPGVDPTKVEADALVQSYTAEDKKVAADVLAAQNKLEALQ